MFLFRYKSSTNPGYNSVMDLEFCRRCGSKTQNKKDDWYICQNGHDLFANPAPTVGVFLVTEDNEVVLSVRGIEPDKGSLDSFGGFAECNESYEAAAIRELKEETGLSTTDYGELVYLTSSPAKYLFQDEYRTITSCFFWAKIYDFSKIKPSDDVADIRVIKIDEVSFDQIFAQDVKVGLQKLQTFFSQYLK